VAGQLIYSIIRRAVHGRYFAKSSHYDAEGNPLAEGDLSSRLENRLRQMPYSSEAYEQVLNYRIQLLAAARGGLGTEQRRQVEKLFRKARLALADQFIEKRPTPTPTPAESEPGI